MSHPRFSIIPAGAVTDRSLEPRDLQVLCLLGRHTDKAGWCFRSQVKMAQEIDCSRASLQNSLERLYVAGWVEKKRRDVEVEEAGKRPSRSHAYRVLLDRDDFAFEAVAEGAETDDGESYAETTSDEGGCQQVGTPVPTPGVGTGAIPYDGTKNVPLERPHLERERDARARDRQARFLVTFEARWPTAAADDRQRTAYAAGALSEDEETAAIAGIGPFLENLKRLGRKNVPAGWRYLEEKRWTLLDQAKEPAVSVAYAKGSPEAIAIAIAYDVAGAGEAFRVILRGTDGTVRYRPPMTPRLLALAQSPQPSEWETLNRQQAAAWEGFLRETVTVQVRKHLAEGDRAPWPWPPSVEGKIYPTGPPPAELSEAELADFK